VSPASQSEDSLAGAAVGGVAWQGLSFISGKAMVLLSTVVLARLLTPADFGLVGLALVFVTYADVITDLGVTQALVYLPAGRHRNDAALLVSVLVSLTFVLLALAAAPLAARFFGEPQVTSMMRLLSLSLLLRGLGQVPDALLRKELRFRPRLYADFFRAGGQGLISIGLAAAGFGPWAIVFGYLAGSAVWTVLVWGLVEYRPGRDFWPIRREAIVSLLAYGAPAAGTSLLLVLVFNVEFPRDKVGQFDTVLVREWFNAFAINAGVTLHVETLYGENSHHIAESCFKGLARALRAAVAIDPRAAGEVPSTKGQLGG